ncbi:MAG: hypothetical protein KDD64_15195, partial [Bdellovibrionales bacterium]|nr:hypothetical protein [Bdellovibrionales bacterium]
MRSSIDPRYYQIATLASLVLYGACLLDFSCEYSPPWIVIPACLSLQFLFGRAVGLKTFDPKSPLISSLSLCLLLRTSS